MYRSAAAWLDSCFADARRATMQPMNPRRIDPRRPAGLALGALAWALAWLAMLLLDGRVDLANLALLPVLAAALAALRWPLGMSLAACAATVLAFNWAFVPPRGSFTVDLHQHALLLLTLLSVSWIITLLMARQRRLVLSERRHGQRARQLQALAATLRDADDLHAAAAALQTALQTALGSLGDGAAAAPVTVLLLRGALPERDDPDACLQLGTADADQTAGLWLCLRQRRALGPGSGWYEEQDAWYLPVRGSGVVLGAALVPLPTPPADADTLRQHAQALCDQVGLALQRAAAVQAAALARQDAQNQRLRNTLLAAISHDHRTPLASILAAASALHDQADRLSPQQRRRLAASIVDEASQLRRLTDNTLQLARLDSPGLALQLDWESVEEIVGSVLRRVRQRDGASRVKSRLEPGLPLLRCDAVLLVQLLDNLVDNALKYGGETAPVEILARRLGDRLLLAVRDRGPGVAAAWRERVFGVFERGEPAAGVAPAADALRPGAGVGLALCRSIARAHGGELALRARGHGGSSFECTLPLEEPPQQPPQETR